LRVAESVRLDVWLDVACLFKTRSEAQRACKGGKVDVNGSSAKPHREVRPGDEIEITRGYGRRQKVRIIGLEEKHIEKAKARELYEDITPPPTAEELEIREMERVARRYSRPIVTPDKRQRRVLRRMRGKG
jgi:ribosome-associated heat shock protein Hsp15